MLSNVIGGYFIGVSARGMKLTFHLHIMPKKIINSPVTGVLVFGRSYILSSLTTYVDQTTWCRMVT